MTSVSSIAIHVMTVIHRFVTTYARSNYLTILNYVLKFKKYDKNHGHFTAKIHST